MLAAPGTDVNRRLRAVTSLDPEPGDSDRHRVEHLLVAVVAPVLVLWRGAEQREHRVACFIADAAEPAGRAPQPCALLVEFGEGQGGFVGLGSQR